MANHHSTSFLYLMQKLFKQPLTFLPNTPTHNRNSHLASACLANLSEAATLSTLSYKNHSTPSKQTYTGLIKGSQTCNHVPQYSAFVLDLPTIDHLLASDFLNNATLLFTSDATHFDSHVTRTIDNHTQVFVSRLTAYTAESETNPTLPDHAVKLLYFPGAQQGGVGYRSPYVSATASFVLPIARSIRLAKQGVSNPSDPSSSTAQLPPTIRNVLNSWQHDDTRLFRLFRRYGELLSSPTTSPNPPKATLTSQYSLKRLNSKASAEIFTANTTSNKEPF
jgi:hypothetical protein